MLCSKEQAFKLTVELGLCVSILSREGVEFGKLHPSNKDDPPADLVACRYGDDLDDQLYDVHSVSDDGDVFLQLMGQW